MARKSFPPICMPLSKREKYNNSTYNTSCENNYLQYLHYSLQP